MNIMKHRNTIYFIMILAISLAVVSGCKKQVSVNQNQSINQNQNTNTNGEIDTSNWKTYRNEEFGFEFKYPREINNIEFKIREGVAFRIDGALYEIEIWPLGWQDAMFIIDIMKLDDFEKYSKELILPNSVQKEFQLKNRRVAGFSWALSYNANNVETTNVDYKIFIPHQKVGYIIQAFGQYNYKFAGYIGIVDKILSTLDY